MQIKSVSIMILVKSYWIMHFKDIIVVFLLVSE